MKSKKNASTSTTAHCIRTLTDKLLDAFCETSVHINLLNARGKTALSKEAVLEHTETFLGKRMPLFFLMWIRILRMLIEEVEVTIHHVDDGTGMVVMEPDNCVGSMNQGNVVRYVKLPDPYARREYYDAAKVMFSVVGQDHDKATSKVTRTHLGFFPIHGPWAEMFRPRMTQGIFSREQSTTGGTWWHPVEDLFQLEDFIPHIQASFNDMIILLFCGSDNESVLDAEKKERDFICSLPLYVKRCIELDLASVMTNASATKYHPALVIPLLDENEDTTDDIMIKTPLANGRETARYFTSPTYITFNTPYDRLPPNAPLDGSELPHLPLKQTPTAAYTEIEERVIQLHKAFAHIKMASALTVDEAMVLPVVIKFDGTTTYRGIPSRLFVLFSQYFGRDAITQKKNPIGGCGPDNIANLKRKVPTPYDSEMYNTYIYGKRRQIATGVYHSSNPSPALHPPSPSLTPPRLSPTRSTLSYPIKTDSLPHDALIDYFSYLFMVYLSPNPTSTSLFLSQLILYRIQDQMDIWSGQKNDGSTIGTRDIPDVASIVRFRVHQLLLNGLLVRYASLYWTNFTERPINSTVRRNTNLSTNGTDTSTVSGTLADIYTGSFIEILKGYDFVHNDTQDMQIFLTKYKAKCDSIKEIFMAKNHYKVPLCVTMNFNFFLTTAVRHFTEAKMMNLIKSLSNTEKTYYDDENEEPPKSYFLFTQIHSMASKIAHKLESYEFNAHKKQIDMGLLE
jgi:hypothetical protein